MRTDYQSVVFTMNARDFPILVWARDRLSELRQQSESTTEDSFVLLRAVRIAESGVCSFLELLRASKERIAVLSD